MLFYLLILAGICLYRLKVADNQSSYMFPDQTTSVKGIFVAIILLSHMRQYIAPSLPMDDVALKILNKIGQLMVTLFFFYSGYGVLSSVGKKENYGKTFFRNRLCKTWLHFAIAVSCYLVLSLILGTQYGAQDYLLCWTGWTSLGNSNWFIFVMLALYVITWLGLKLTQGLPRGKAQLAIAIGVTVLSIILRQLLRVAGKESYWYNTLLCYAAGMWFFLGKPLFDKLLGKWYLRIGMWFACLTAFYLLHRVPVFMGYDLYACVFCLLVILVTTNVRIDNAALRWLGKHTFTIYIFQRIPMIVLKRVGLSSHNVLFMVLSVVFTLGLATLFDTFYKKLDVLFRDRPANIVKSDC